MYESLIGPYPYAKFALIENFWETGFGMPSFTLLGSRVIRLPFIVNSSYPHEILHNWWGNGVYVDYASGNWSEGLTAYLADHLIKEQQGKGVSYRQQALQKYTDYAAKDKDFALTEFRSRHSSASEAVGYGKSLMFFHMLRKKLGDKVFIQGLKALYQQQKFKVTSFSDIQDVFEKVSEVSLQAFFDQWVKRVGAPMIKLNDVEFSDNKRGYLLSFTLNQIQSSDLYALDIPVSIVLESGEIIYKTLSLNTASDTYKIQLDSRPARLDIDPEFDIFRKLSAQEIPAAFTQVFGSNKVSVVLPSNTSPRLDKTYAAFAQQIKHMGSAQVEIIKDNQLSKLPQDNAVILIGWKNHFLDDFKKQLSKQSIAFLAEKIIIDGTTVSTKNLSIALTTRQGKQQLPLSFIATDTADALNGLARKLPHYHKYSYIGFTGNVPTNTLKGRWPVNQSSLSFSFAQQIQNPKAISRPLLH